MNKIGNGTVDHLPSTGCFFIIIYPRGDQTKISIAEAQDFDVLDYALASRFWFWNEHECVCYAKLLSKENNLIFDYQSDESNFLD